MTITPYGIISDSHNHAWSAFSETDADGVNSRLRIILNETLRCAREIKALGGQRMYHAGDLFHVRGSIAPSVLNPTAEVYAESAAMGIEVRALSGNHDLEFREATRNGSAITVLEGVGCKIVNTTTYFNDDRVAMIPWHQNIESLKKEILEAAKHIEAMPSPPPLRSMEQLNEWTLMIHAPIDGVIPGLPSHGLSDAWLALRGFKQVFSGHYHNHKEFGNGVVSVGALTHNSWSDVGSKAGFLLVEDRKVAWRKTHAPHFVEINSAMSEEDAALTADGNYVRCTMSSDKTEDVERIREFLTKSGAKGINILYQKKVVEIEREETSTVAAGASIETSVSDYVSRFETDHPTELAALCQSILTDARMVTA